MGYYTRHELVIEGHENPELLIEELRELYEYARYALEEDGSTGDECKWYESESDLRAFSKYYPGVLFTLFCHGEDGERWVYYVKDGKSYSGSCEVTIVYESFDESKLK